MEICHGYVPTIELAGSAAHSEYYRAAYYASVARCCQKLELPRRLRRSIVSFDENTNRIVPREHADVSKLLRRLPGSHATTAAIV